MSVPYYYFESLYPLQDRVLAVLQTIETEFYLTGGTALSRYYCHHRFSDDLDLFVNDDPNFVRWGERFIAALLRQGMYQITVAQKDEMYMRLMLSEDDVLLKIDLVNDVPAHIGRYQHDTILGTVDSMENILANKITALLSRREPKDLADIWALTTMHNMSLPHALTDARSKAAGVFPVALAQVLLEASSADWDAIRWNNPPPVDEFVTHLHSLGDALILSG
jgi:predicted nucleotidyltransferase component of viral defense system